MDSTGSVGGELHLPRERVASSTLEKLAASRMPEIAIEHYRESRIPGRRLNKREKRVEYLVFSKGYPPEEATWEPWENLKGDDAVEALVKEFHRKYPRSLRDRRISLE
jgi:hypothetical protein